MKNKPTRIISLVPSITELLFDLGLEDEVIGITKFCVHPTHWFRTKTRIGGTKTLHINQIKTLNPEFIIANKEENVKEQIDELSNLFPVYVSDIQLVEEALDMIADIAKACGKEEKGEILLHTFLDLKKTYIKPIPKRVLYLIWQKPWMAAGADTFIHSMLELAGFENVITQTRYPVLNEEDIQALKPDYIFLSSEPFPFKQKHVEACSSLWPSSRITCVDGEIFSWYGSRMLKSFDYFRTLNEQLA